MNFIVIALIVDFLWVSLFIFHYHIGVVLAELEYCKFLFWYSVETFLVQRHYYTSNI
jgi:hypothetical protein